MRNPLSDDTPLGCRTIYRPYVFIALTDEQLITQLEICAGKMHDIQIELRRRITRRSEDQD